MRTRQCDSCQRSYIEPTPSVDGGWTWSARVQYHEGLCWSCATLLIDREMTNGGWFISDVPEMDRRLNELRAKEVTREWV